MDISTFLIVVYCQIDDILKNYKLRKRGPQPKLNDSEVITMEIVGEFLGVHTGKGLYTFFKRHYASCFPTIRSIHRTTFTRQATNLWKVKEQIWQELLQKMSFDRQFLWLIDFQCLCVVLPEPTVAANCAKSRLLVMTKLHVRPFLGLELT